MFRKSVHSLEMRLQETENRNKTLVQDAIIQKFRSEQFEEEIKKLKIEKEQIEQFHRTKVEVSRIREENRIKSLLNSEFKRRHGART